MITEKTYHALSILNEHDWEHPMTANEFAKKMWPDSPAWRKVYNTGNGATSGKGMWLCAGSYLNKLLERQLVVHDLCCYTPVWRISLTGRMAIQEYEKLTQNKA